MNQITEIKLHQIEKTIMQAIQESEVAIYDKEKGYAYAAGYCRSALKQVLDDVQQLLNS